MQYLKLGPIRIPYAIEKDGPKKTFRICGLRIPFTTYSENGYKYYKIAFLRLRFKSQEKYLINQRYSNYLIRDELTEEKIRELSVKIFEEKLGYTPDLENPKSMNEKIFWLKLNYHNPLITKCCDKFAVKDYVTEKLGAEYVVPTIASWDKAEDLDLSILPDKYALKVNWSSGYNIIVKEKGSISESAIRESVERWMRPQQNSYYHTFNWGYKNIKPVVYAEEYMEQIDGQLYDYKFFCCNGKVKFWFIATDRYQGENLTHDFFDMNFQKMEFDYGGRSHSDLTLEKPRFYNEMVRCAEILAEPFPFVRVDFYETNDRFYVGEMTFYPGGGILPFTPKEWDFKLGENIELDLDKLRNFQA